MNRLDFINKKGSRKKIDAKQDVVIKNVKVDDYGPSPVAPVFDRDSVPFTSTEVMRRRIGTIFTDERGVRYLIIDEKGTVQRLDPVIQG